MSKHLMKGYTQIKKTIYEKTKSLKNISRKRLPLISTKYTNENKKEKIKPYIPSIIKSPYSNVASYEARQRNSN